MSLGLLVARISLVQAADAPNPSPYVDGTVLVAPREGRSLERIAAKHRVRLARRPGPSGWGTLLAENEEALLRELRADPDVRAASLEGRTRGTGGNAVPLPLSARAERTPRWHLDALGIDAVKEPLDDVTVAILDTGVAWRRHTVGGRPAPVAQGLASTRFVAAADFIEHDGAPDDDHQHGTHVASLIAGRGFPAGIAPGVRIMPVKVLDRDDVGTELALVDGIHHAVLHGADIVNMSLSFGPGYVPGPALVEAIARAEHAGVLMIAAAGNESSDEVTQPAANPAVLAVGATRPAPGGLAPASYSNANPRVDLTAPGGALDADRNGDGVLDGIPAETIHLQDPTRIGTWMYAGTSQAAALVTGIAARLLHANPGTPRMDARQVALLLALASRPSALSGVPWQDGHGRGQIAWTPSRTSRPLPPIRRPCVAMLGWLEAKPGGWVRPMLRTTVIDERGRRLAGAEVVGHLDGTGGAAWSCRTERDGACLATGAWRKALPDDAWTWFADTVVLEGLGWHPGSALFESDGLHALLAGIAADERTRDASLAFRWTERELPGLGHLARAVLVVDLDVHRARVPWARITVPDALRGANVASTGSLVVSAANPDRAPTVRIVRDDQAGPWGWTLLRAGRRPMLVLEAWAMRASAIGVTAPGLFAGMGPALRAVRIGTGTVPGPVAENRRSGVELTGSPLAAWLEAGGAPGESPP